MEKLRLGRLRMDDDPACMRKRKWHLPMDSGGRSQFMAVVCRDARHHRPSFFSLANPSDGCSMKERYGTASGFLLGYILSCIYPDGPRCNNEKERTYACGQVPYILKAKALCMADRQFINPKTRGLVPAVRH